jgi:release factor glutamine methyltransferase
MMPDEVRGLFENLIARHGARCTALPDKPEESTESTVRGLWLCAAGIPVSAERAMTMDLPPLTAQQQQRLTDLIEQREQGIPLAHLTGRQQFMGLEYICTGKALIPRKETEILGNAARNLLTQQILPARARPQVLDLCTGSGNIACAIAICAHSCVVYGVDLSPEAIDLAGVNARLHGCGDHVKLFCGDLFTPFESQQFHHFFDLITCNPPYITTAKLTALNPEIIAHEPRMAFDGGPLGVRVLMRLLQDAPRFLRIGGWLAFEVGQGQGPGILQRLRKNNQYSEVTNFSDNNGHIRAIAAQISSNVPADSQNARRETATH